MVSGSWGSDRFRSVICQEAGVPLVWPGVFCQSTAVDTCWPEPKGSIWRELPTMLCFRLME